MHMATTLTFRGKTMKGIIVPLQMKSVSREAARGFIEKLIKKHDSPRVIKKMEFHVEDGLVLHLDSEVASSEEMGYHLPVTDDESLIDAAELLEFDIMANIMSQPPENDDPDRYAVMRRITIEDLAGTAAS